MRKGLRIPLASDALAIRATPALARDAPVTARRQGSRHLVTIDGARTARTIDRWRNDSCMAA